MSLWQIHHQRRADPDGPTEMCAQREIEGHAEMMRFVGETKASHPLPEGAMYLAVTEDSPRFWVVPV
jgi:hypothetical protein